MKLSAKIICIFSLLLFTGLVKAQDLPINPDLLSKKWTALWVSHPNAAQRAYGVYHFRKNINLGTKPSKYIIHVSADNRYRFFVNGKPVCFGPARGDLYNWYFETIDIAPYLKAGDNVLAALVWNMGEHAPVAQVSNQTGLVVQGNSAAEQAVNTNASWLVTVNKAYKPCSTNNSEVLKTYFVVGPGDELDANLYPWGWEQAGYDDSKWQHAVKVMTPSTVGYGTDNLWTLTQRTIPLMEERFQRMSRVRRAVGITPGNAFLKGNSPLTIGANKKVSILIDQDSATLAYPELLVSGGKGAVVKITYAEALFKDGVKGNRNDIEGKEILGNFDVFKPDGKDKRSFRPLWQRSFRYIQLDITTTAEPLIINDFFSWYTGYPFVQKATFSSNDASLKDIWNVGWRTARLCAGENYYDCPYYEQLQYVADTRIMSLISLYVSGDDRLMRKAIHDFYLSRVPEGLTQGRYPSNRIQVIPPFSLYWVSMLHDYMMYRNDDAFLKQYLTAATGVLDWYENRIDPEKNMLGPMKWWNFTDWANGFQDMGVPPGATDGNSAIISLQYAYTLKQAAQLYTHFGLKQQAAHYEELAAKINQATYQHCFDNARNLFGDTPEKRSYSQHASIMGVLSDAVPQEKQQTVLNNVLADNSLTQATFYYRFYLAQAMKKAGLANKYYAQLTPWRNMLKQGLTTFAETPDPSRSDCHGWSASPNYDFLATICGISPVAPGYKKVEIKPALGELTSVTGVVPIPAGNISVSINRKGSKGANVVAYIPNGVEVYFIWNNKQTVLKNGKNEFYVE